MRLVDATHPLQPDTARTRDRGVPTRVSALSSPSSESVCPCLLRRRQGARLEAFVIYEAITDAKEAWLKPRQESRRVLVRSWREPVTVTGHACQWLP